MSESVFKSLLEESVKCEWNEFDNVEEHVFSQKHNRAMKRIFKLYEKNTKNLHSDSFANARLRVRFTKKSIFIAVVFVLFALLAGCGVAYFISKSFRGEVHSEYTKLFAAGTENCATTIIEKYYLSVLPYGFEKKETESSPYYECTIYINNATGKSIMFCQYTKAAFDTVHANTEKHSLEEIEVNGDYGVCIDFSDDKHNSSLVIWDNGQYIFEIEADLSKDEALNLANFAKICEK